MKIKAILGITLAASSAYISVATDRGNQVLEMHMAIAKDLSEGVQDQFDRNPEIVRRAGVRVGKKG